MSYLYAAYILTWAIHLAYIGTLVRRHTRLRKELHDLSRK
jgi:CcmD family protein